jgi:hypothetical protein
MQGSSGDSAAARRPCSQSRVTNCSRRLRGQLPLGRVSSEQTIDLALSSVRLPAQSEVLDLYLAVMQVQIALIGLDDVDRGQSECPRAAHPAAQIECIL